MNQKVATENGGTGREFQLLNNVGELRKFITDLPDDMPLSRYVTSSSNDGLFQVGISASVSWTAINGQTDKLQNALRIEA